MAHWLDGVIKEKHQWTERLFSLRIAAPLPGFTAGQFVRIALDIDGEQVDRPYSLVNAPHEPLLEVYFDIVPGGPLTPRLARLEPGDPVKVIDRAAGLLTINEIPDVDHLWMLATGTGIGPFLSALKTDEPWQRFKKIVLGYSVRQARELSYMDTIAALQAARQDRMVFVPFVTRETPAGAIHARITSAIESGLLEARAGIVLSPDSSHVMLCGNSAMITEVSDLLGARGMRRHRRREPGHITTEKYH
ncbi:MAG: ferredoxin--NADP+ reductase [Gammaproteobacteria bacterium]|nr:MAG: ferredoxin--NADP+ reductase [Gammaproteobacteria bacterium]TND02300.1 MAG: ferredoxin--NADP+ reductase [Gammaproteobacteria bacterium]